MKLPDIKSFESPVEYFRELYQTNKALKSSFSHRSFARKVRWPSSYLSDIIKGRKKLTISRSLQFAQALKFTHLETEYLLTLCLSDYDDDRVRSFFREEVTYKNLSKAKQASFRGYLGLFDNIRAMYLRELILWGQGKVALSNLLEAQIPFPELKDPELLNETLRFLSQKKLIVETKPGFFKATESETFALDDDAFTIKHAPDLAKHYIAQLEILSRLYRYYTGAGFAFSGYLDFNKDRYPEIQKRMFELRDWMIGLSKEAKSADITKNDTFQFEMHFIPMFNFKAIKSFSS